MATEEEPIEVLRSIGRAGDGPHDIANAALMLAALDNPERPLVPYRDHLAEIADGAKTVARECVGLSMTAHALCNLMSGAFGYEGDRLSYDDPRNADLMSVIDRRRGLPVSLGILFIHAARSAGLEATGLTSPGHFTLRVTAQRLSAIIDPFACQVAEDGFVRPPRMMGTAMGEAVSDIDVLLRLQNNMRLRALNAGDRMRALDLARRLVILGPARADLWFELAQQSESVGALSAARGAYEACLEIARPGQNLHNEAALALFTLKRKLN